MAAAEGGVRSALFAGLEGQGLGEDTGGRSEDAGRSSQSRAPR